MTNQNQMILKALNDGDVLTGLEALERFKTMKLATRISELRASGIEIKDSFIHAPNGKKYKQYWIKKEPIVQTLV